MTHSTENDVPDCDGTGLLPRSMGERLPDGTITGLCVSCQTFQPMYEVIPPSKPEWRREFRLAPHARVFPPGECRHVRVHVSPGRIECLDCGRVTSPGGPTTSCRLGYEEHDGARYCFEHGGFLQAGVKSRMCDQAGAS